MDPAIDFEALYREFDTAVMGRRTFETVLGQGTGGATPGMDIIVFSRMLQTREHPAVTVIATDPVAAVTGLEARPGTDIWLFGGGALFRTLLDADLVDTVEVGVMPVLLGRVIPLLPCAERHARLHPTGCNWLPSGILMLKYGIDRGTAGARLPGLSADSALPEDRNDRHTRDR